MRRTKKVKGHKSPCRKRRNHTIQCLNCNKIGHLYRDCHFPLTSYGILLFRYNKAIEDVEYLMICRRHTFGYVEFIRACYDIHNRDYIKQLLMEMTITERTKIHTMTFRELWEDLWQQTLCYNNEYVKAHNAFKRLMGSQMCNGLLKELPVSVWHVPEWGFPKGKRNILESPLQCAVREMHEESGLVHDKDYTSVGDDCVPKQVTEMFQSTDKRIYRHIYFIYTHCGAVDYVLNPSNRMQMREVSKIEWLTYADCMKNIRCYNVAKQKMLSDVHPAIVQHCKTPMIHKPPTPPTAGPTTHPTLIIKESYKGKTRVLRSQASQKLQTSLHAQDNGESAPGSQKAGCQQTIASNDQHGHAVCSPQPVKPVS